MFISHEEFNSIMNEAYLKGYDDGKIEGQREIMQAMLTPNDIRKAFNFPNMIEDEEKRLTCRQLLAKEHPDCIDPIFTAECKSCPHNYGYISFNEALCDNMHPPEKTCIRCWNQVATKYYEKENTNDNFKK